SILHDPPAALPPQVSPGVRDLILRCLEKDRVRRYQKACEVRAAMESIQSAQLGSVVRPVERKAKRLWLTLALLIPVLTAVLWIYRRQVGAVHSTSGLPEQRQLAILPIAIPTDLSESSAFANGLVDTLAARLTQLTASHSLAVIP